MHEPSRSSQSQQGRELSWPATDWGRCPDSRQLVSSTITGLERIVSLPCLPVIAVRPDDHGSSSPRTLWRQSMDVFVLEIAILSQFGLLAPAIAAPKPAHRSLLPSSKHRSWDSEDQHLPATPCHRPVLTVGQERRAESLVIANSFLLW